jgi:hypothetical protein
MTVTARQAQSSIPVYTEDLYVIGNASGTALVVNPGDYVAFSGQYIVAAEDALAYWKASGVGIALDANPAYDPAGRPIVNSAIVVATRGIFRVTANFSGQVNLGVIAYPDTTGSALAAPSGFTGVASRWNTAAPSTVSGGTAAAAGKGVAQVIAWYGANAVAGTGQMDIRLWARPADFY